MDAASLPSWEIEVQLHMRTTLRFSGPKTEAHARALVGLILAGEVGDIAAFVKPGSDQTNRPFPVRTIVDNNPTIVAVRQVPEGDGAS
jgi:hypothetical protein